MSSESNTGQDVPIGDLLVVLGCLVAVALLVVSLPSIGAAIGPDDGASIDQQPTPDDALSAAGVIGGGAGGAAPVSSIGVVDGSDAVTPFRNQSAARAFTVTTAAPGYWRTDAYTEYDGRWIRTGEQTPYTGTLPSSRPVTAQVTQNVTTAQPTAVFPASYQPGRLNVSDPTAITVSSERGMHPETQISNNTSYTVESYRYTPSLELLRTSEANYPVSIKERYTQLPNDLPARVGELGTELTAETDSPFEAANAIDKSLAADKAYSLEATHESGADPVDQFLFEMEGGDAQYFASSMVVLLRTQGIPARYVTGYSVGEPVGNDTYVVRDVNAHAWVEVYFSGHGWIAFDPTPVDERISVEDAAVENGTMAHVPLVNENASTIPLDLDRILDDPLPDDETEPLNTSEPSSDGTDTDSDGESDSDGTDTDSDGESDSDGTDGEGGSGTDGSGGSSDDGTTTENSNDTASSDDSLAVSLSPESPQPGDSVTVTVTRDEEPVQGVTVAFNGEEIGQTDAEGEVRGTVPYVRTLEISVTEEPTALITSTDLSVPGAGLAGGKSRVYNLNPPEMALTGETDGASSTGTVTTGDGDIAGRSEPPRTAERILPSTRDHIDTETPAQTGTNRSTTVVSVPLDAVATVDVNPTPVVSGGDVTVRMLVNGRPVPAADVQIAGQVVGETNETGYVTATVPESVNGSAVPVRAQRGEIDATHAVVAGPLQTTLTPERTVVLPGQTVTIQATVHSVPVADVPVRQDGGTVGTTDMNGTIAATLPFARASTITIAYPGREITQSISGMARNAILLAGGGLFGVSLIGAVVRRSLRGRSVGDEDQSGVRRLLVVGQGVGVWVTTQLLTLQARTAGIGARLLAGITTPQTAILGLWARRPKPLWQPLVAAIGFLVALVRSRGGAETATAAGDGRPGAGSAGESTTESGVSIQQAWGSFVRLVVRRVDTTQTPAELAERGIEAGLPREPVEQLTESFRVVEYGRENPDNYVDTANTALTDIESTTDPETDDSHQDPEDA